MLIATHGSSQKDSLLKRTPTDTSKLLLNMDAVYNRPFLQYGKIPVALGGYAEANSEYRITKGKTEGLSFQMRRMTLFVSSAIQKKIKFLSEIEFEDGTKEINIEFAAIDLQFHHLFNVRSGVIMNPIGAFNQNHDGPRWEFIDRPISATQMLPATFSNAGFGVFGKVYKPGFVWAYEVYLTNGFNNRIIENNQGHTYLPAVKSDPARFEESYNGQPLLSAKTSLRVRQLGEIGLSYMGGVYNKFEDEGLTIDKRRRADVAAIDFNSRIPRLNTTVVGEFAWIFIDVPKTFGQQFGNRQHGGFIDIVQPFAKGKLLGFEKATANVALRFEYVDWNNGSFNETNQNIADEMTAIVPAISFRPSSQTVIRFNYRMEWRKDLLGNLAVRSTIFQLGLSSYF
jgi:hypothetical protein